MRARGRRRTVKARLRDSVELGIEELTVYSFSTENWSRSPTEVQGLFEMFSRRIAGETPELHAEGVRMRFIGRREGSRRISRADALGGGADRRQHPITMFVAFNYGGRAEIVDAAMRFAHSSGEPTVEEFRRCLYAPEMHDPDLIIRTSGERRLSNYLLWQSAYSELVFREELWPDFTREALEQSLAEFSARRRRFGGRCRPGRSDLAARVLAALPAIAFALFIVIEGGPVFALGVLALGWICMHELFAMYERAHPVRLAGFIALAGLLAAALYGSPSPRKKCCSRPSPRCRCCSC